MKAASLMAALPFFRPTTRQEHRFQVDARGQRISPKAWSKRNRRRLPVSWAVLRRRSLAQRRRLLA